MADEDRVKPKPISIADAQLPTGEESVLDPTENPWEFAAPPPKGDYQLKFMLGSNGFQLVEPKDGDLYYQADIECRIESDDADINGFPAFMRVTTRIGRGKNISTAAGLVVKLAGKLPKTQASPLTVIKWLDKCLKAEPVRWSHLDWEGRYAITRPAGTEQWKNYATTMEGFPKLPDGSHKHIVTVPLPGGGQEEVRARLSIKHVYAKGEAPQQRSKAPTVQAAPVVEAPKPDDSGSDDLAELDLD